MKRTWMMICACLCLAGLACACSDDDDGTLVFPDTDVPDTDGTDTDGTDEETDPYVADGWKLIWSDEFNRDDYIDETIWTKLNYDVVGSRSSTWNNYMADYDELYDVKDGHLILRGIYNKGENAPYPADTCSYLTGGIWTKNSGASFLGMGKDVKLVIRAKLWSAQGAWPAFWMKPMEADQQALSSEVDIMEHYNYADYILQTCWDGYVFANDLSTSKHQGKGTYDPDDYNDYSVEVHPDELVFQTNGVTSLSYARIETEDPDFQFPYYDHPFYLLIDMQVEGIGAGTADPNDFPVEFWVDWVRYYQKD